MTEKTFSQSWVYPKLHPKGKPIFFESGKRVSIQRGYELTIDSVFGSAVEVRAWFHKNDFQTDEQRTCPHTAIIKGEWVYDYTDDDGEDQYMFRRTYEEPTSEDVDLHHYKCTQCGKIRRY